MRHTYFVTCVPGLEPGLHAELRDLGLAKIERQVGGCRFEGVAADAWTANLWSRTAGRVLQRLTRFDCPNDDRLHARVNELPWERWLAPEGSIWVDAHVRDSALTHSRFVEQRTKDAIVDRFRDLHGTRPDVDPNDPDLRVHVHLWRDRATVSLDTTGEPLYKRGWRKAQGRAPLPESTAAGMVLRSGWNRRAPLVDPFCGSGTILVEAGWLAAGRAPGAGRTFAFERWLEHDAPAYAKVRDAARAAGTLPKKLQLVGHDRDPARVEEARENLAASGLADVARVSVADAREFAPRPGWNAWIVTNPPWGERVGGKGDLPALWGRWGKRLREHCAGYHLTVLCSRPELIDLLELPLSRSTLIAGGLEATMADGDIAG